MLAADTMEKLGIKRGDYVVKVNNRKVLDGVMEAIGLGGEENAGRRLTVLRAIDKLDEGYGLIRVDPVGGAVAVEHRALQAQPLPVTQLGLLDAGDELAAQLALVVAPGDQGLELGRQPVVLPPREEAVGPDDRRAARRRVQRRPHRGGAGTGEVEQHGRVGDPGAHRVPRAVLDLPLAEQRG